MAFTRIVTDSSLATKLPFYYCVSFSVGTGGKNVLDDVMLVQYFLRRWCRDRPQDSLLVKNPNFVNGVCGLTTRNLIFHFQRHYAAQGKRISLDGLVDKPQTETRYSSISKTYYAMIGLNFAFQYLEPYLWSVLPTAPDLPPILKARLAVPASL